MTSPKTSKKKNSKGKNLQRGSYYKKGSPIPSTHLLLLFINQPTNLKLSQSKQPFGKQALPTQQTNR